MSANLTAPQFTNEDKAIEHLEASRWPDEVYCPHCGATSSRSWLAPAPSS